MAEAILRVLAVEIQMIVYRKIVLIGDVMMVDIINFIATNYKDEDKPALQKHATPFPRRHHLTKKLTAQTHPHWHRSPIGVAPLLLFGREAEEKEHYHTN